jgi:undecaprenyl-diphosphatase
MTDSLQRALHAAAVAHPLLGTAAVFCANALMFVLVLALAGLLWRRRQQVTGGLLARMAASLLVATALTVVFGHLVPDPRPYLAEHYAPLAHVAADNGFPSGHTLVAALLTGWAGWLSRRGWPAFAAGLAAVMLGRLAIGAHHTLDVLGSVAFAAAGLTLATQVRLPAAWHTRPLWPGRTG